MEADEFLDFWEFENYRPLRVFKRYIRDFSDLFQMYHEREFKARFRFSKRVVRDILCPIVEETLSTIFIIEFQSINNQIILIFLKVHINPNSLWCRTTFVDGLCTGIYMVLKTMFSDQMIS
ncbi:hypothetical protein ABEB36_011089 [Hypothenemus hampei]|uniref:Maturase K n=1 Tax=Hypothenemus hampei TaxID=57062 RepID=A0ABD1EEQ1_HYPHA